MGKIITFVLLIAIIGLLIHFTNKKDEKLLKIGDCVHKTTVTEGFKGSNKDAWSLFADQCAINLK